MKYLLFKIFSFFFKDFMFSTPFNCIKTNYDLSCNVVVHIQQNFSSEVDKWEKELIEVSQKFKVNFVLKDIQILEKEYKLHELYKSSLVDFPKSDDNAIHVYIVAKDSDLQGFAIPDCNQVYLHSEAVGLDKTTLAHEIGHLLGLKHTFDMSDETKEELEVKEYESVNLMNYNNYTFFLSEKQIEKAHQTGLNTNILFNEI